MSSKSEEYAGGVDQEANTLNGSLLDISDCFAFQLESAPQTGYLHYQGTSLSEIADI